MNFFNFLLMFFSFSRKELKKRKERKYWRTLRGSLRSLREIVLKNKKAGPSIDEPAYLYIVLKLDQYLDIMAEMPPPLVTFEKPRRISTCCA